MSGQFTISLDFELMWGVRDKRSVQSYGSNILGARKAIPKMLQLFQDNGVHATWSTVGTLFCRNKDELLNHLPTELASYENPKFGVDNYIYNVGKSEEDDPYNYASSLIELIISTDYQEVSTHTFTHFYCLEKGQTLKQFDLDLKQALLIAKSYGIDISSIIFPRNQVDDNYLDVCKRNKVIIYRGNPEHLIYQEQSQSQRNLIYRVIRGLDSFVNLTGTRASKISMENGFINNRASCFFRTFPKGRKYTLLAKLQNNRIKKDMLFAAKNNLNFHIWWHPHNFGSNTEKCFSFLEDILIYYRLLNSKYGFTSISMSESSKHYCCMNNRG